MKKLLVLLLLSPFVSLPAVAQEPTAPSTPAVTQQEVSTSLRRATEFIKSCQSRDGSWPYDSPEHVQGASALAVLALSEAGLRPDDPAIAKGLEFVKSKPYVETYDSACALMAYVSVDPARYIQDAAEARNYLSGAQNAAGMWSYKRGDPLRTSGDNSNTQFAILGLRAAMSVGLSVPPDVLQKAEQHYASTQNADGGWGYRPANASYGSMTAAGVASLYILGGRLYVAGDVCGQYRTDPRVAAGFSWLVQNFDPTNNPGGPDKWSYYWLYALERVGVLTGQKYIGVRDWYLDGARFILNTQNPDGSWASGRDQLPDTCFAVLFLSKGNAPVLINKLVHSGDWNPDIHDAQYLTDFLSAKFGQRLGWQTITLNDSLDNLLCAPVLYLTGHTLPDFTAAEKATLKAFFENGGFMFAEACCSRKAFDTGLRKLVADLFPDAKLAPLERSHPVYHSWFNLTSSKYTLYGVNTGCRTPLIYSPADVSCAWEKQETRSEAFQVGANIAAYATGKEALQPKLEQAPRIMPRQVISAPPGAFVFAQLSYAGRWDPHPVAGPKLLQYVNEKAGLPVATSPVTLPLTDENLPNYPFVYMTGPARFSLSDDEKKALKSYLERGGFLFADATSGKPEFDQSFRALMDEVFPESPLAPIPPDSPLYSMAFDTRRVKYTAAVRELNPNLDTLTLFGVKVDSRVAVVYSPYDVGCALTGSPSYGSKGLVTGDAFRVAANIVLYALTY